uniref:Secreted Lectin-like protein n=1 Tax=Pristhesancus plagipennis TaxID=1955184 RepID=A0A2K8JV15_PRIPG|nr:secreted Lectin-like protein [Pristhesancus plagipennis]
MYHYFYYYLACILLGALSQSVLAEEILRDLACENERMVLTCKNGYSIKIQTALYGKTNPLYCRMPGKTEINCSSRNALDIVKSKCNWKGKCTLDASNKVFGDPCPGTVKYLEVTYDCIKSEILSKFACENEEISINCPKASYIQISNAIYGRTNQAICSVFQDKVVRSNKCQAENALSVVESKCNKKEECKFKASNSIFGDPCEGTFKYLQVDYQCLYQNED